MSLVPLFLLLAAFGLYWYTGAQAREKAVRVAIEACRAQRIQFLDGSVTLLRTRLRRGQSGRLGLQRTFRFEYSEDSASRRQGFVVMAGSTVEAVGLAPGSADDQSTATTRRSPLE